MAEHVELPPRPATWHGHRSSRGEPRGQRQSSGSAAAARPELHCATTRWVSHAWCSRPDVFLAAEVWNRPQKGALAHWALALEAVAVKLKIAAADIAIAAAAVFTRWKFTSQLAQAVLLRLLDSPEHHAAAVQATLRSALHHCAKVSQEEVLPSLRFFTMKSGAAPQEWHQALARGAVRQLKSGDVGPASGADPFDPELWEEVLSSDRQRAVLRSLQAAGSLGLPEADFLVQDLAAHFCACERLAHQALRHSQVAAKRSSKPKTVQVERWHHAPFRCISELPREDAQPHTERGPRSLRPLDLQIGPVRSCDGLDESIARLVQVVPEPVQQRPASQATGRRSQLGRRAPRR